MWPKPSSGEEEKNWILSRKTPPVFSIQKFPFCKVEKFPARDMVPAVRPYSSSKTESAPAGAEAELTIKFKKGDP